VIFSHIVVLAVALAAWRDDYFSFLHPVGLGVG
jgi:hypothetical protein